MSWIVDILCANTLLCVHSIHLSQAFTNVADSQVEETQNSFHFSFIECTCTVWETMVLLVTTISLNSFPTMAFHQRLLSLALTVVLLALPSLTYGVTLHVRPTPTNTSCPTHPCHTLSEYAQDPGEYFNETNLSLQFLPGSHTLNVNLTISNISQLEITNVVVPTKIVCDSNVGFILRNISVVRIEGLAFVGCAKSGIVQVFDYSFRTHHTYYGLHLQSVQMAEIIDCAFQDSYGTALGVVDSHVVLRGNNRFLNNCRVCSNGRCGVWGRQCLGGGVFVQRSDLNITGSTTFSDNSASRYGSVGGVCAERSNVHISGNTTFSGNSGSSGGGVTARSSNVTISGNTTFSGNSASGSGGGVSAWDSSNVTISGNTTFSGNSASWSGGGVSAKYSSNVNISGNTTFSGNSASRDGGGVSAGYSSNVYISQNTTISGNSAGWGGGGGVSARYSSNVYISENTTISGNSARLGGGVSVRYSSKVYISGNTTFSGNSARWGGGGGVSAGYSSNVYISENTTFSGNSARLGGGVSAWHSSNVYISENTTISGNSARLGGGGVSAWRSSNVYIGGNSTFSGNSGGSYGGGVNAGRSKVYISGNSTFSGNSASRDGGGVNALDSSNVNISGNTTFSGNSASRDGGGVNALNSSNVYISGNSIFSGNLARLGGGVSAQRSSVYITRNSTFTANGAGFKGGSIYVLQCNMELSGTGLLSDNVAQLDGGGIYAEESNLNFSANLTISNNTAQLGGGIYSDNNIFSSNGHNVLERNVASYYGGGIFIRRTPFICTGKNTFFANSAEEGGGIYATANSTLSLDGVNTFMVNIAHASGGGIWLDNSNLIVKGYNHFVECAAGYEGGAIYSYAATVHLTGNTTFESNTATAGGGLHARWSHVSVTERSKFEKNIAVFGGGIYTDNSTFELNDSITFTGNKANHTGGGIYAARSVLNFPGTSSITENHAAREGGGIYTRDGSAVNLLGSSNYEGNLAEDTGGGISAFRGSFKLAGQNTFESNKAAKGGGLYTFNCTVDFLGENMFITNSAHNHGGGFTVVTSTLLLNGSTTFNGNSAVSGGGMCIDDSKVGIDGNNCFMNNVAEAGGGAIYATDSVLELNGKNGFMTNTAKSKGAAIHTFSSTLILQGNSSFVNNSAKYGGGIYSESSNLTVVHNQSSYLNNTALRGGAQYFDVNSNLSLHPTAHVHFQGNNVTEFGGAIYVEDVPFRSECFFHIHTDQLLAHNTTPLVFENNSAGMRGSVLYGGLLDKCNFRSERYTSALQLFNMSIPQRNGDKGHSISSDPTQLCFCNISKWNCKEITQSKKIYPGQQVEVSVVAIDQLSSVIPELIHTAVRSGDNLTVSETISYETGDNCTSRNYSVTPKNPFNLLELYPSNRSGYIIHIIVNITFEICPSGFEPSNSTGECICDHRLWQYTNSCKIDGQAILRNASSTFWLNVSYNNGHPEGFIHHPFCPLDYCTTESKYINMNDPDKQCNINRSGLLCGKCNEGLSLVLGSSQCKKCSNNYLALLIPFAVAGVLLVILLFLLHLTVAAGTLHGLIFYANIVEANHHIFLPHFSNNPASIFIAWLNLDLGIQTCFYNGMDTYAKTWLDLVFPVYIWVIVGFLVYISGCSVVMTKLLGSSPVPVLATLFLLSYAKLLRTIIAAISLTVLYYPDKNVVVWIHDANVSLAKYIPLVLVAILFLLFLFLPYTLLLLLGQWLQTKSHLCLLSWVRNPKLKAILDTYHAPYKPKHRYWTGMLLLVRCALFLVFAFNISGNDSVNLLVISLTTSGIFIWFALSGMAYKSWCLSVLELSFILNLSIFAVATQHVNQSGGSQGRIAYTSVGIAFLTFVGIVTYHISLQIKSKVQNILCHHENGKCHEKREDNPGNLEHQCGVSPNIVTHTEVNLHELRSPLDLLDTK